VVFGWHSDPQLLESAGLNGNAPGFRAELFHPGSGNELVRGTIYLQPEALAFRSDSAALEIPAHRLLVELVPDDDRIYFRDRAVPGLRIFAGDESILRAPCPGRSGTIRDELERVGTRREVERRLRLLGYSLAGCIAFGWLAVIATHFMVLSLVARVPPDWERRFGDERIAELKNEGELLDDTNRIAQLTALAAPLLGVIPHGSDFRFHIARSEEPNAFALPGGHIVVNTGLLRLADDAELLGVIAHESAHITRKHHARKLIAAAGPFIIFGTFLHSHNGLMNLIGEGSELILAQGFSQEYEMEADETGWNYLVQANLDPRGMIGIFKKFKAEEVREHLNAGMPQALQSHPALDKRIGRLESKWKKLPHQSGFVELPAVDLLPK